MEAIADAADFTCVSTISLEGDRSPKTTTVEFRSLPPGDYKVTATLISVNGHRRAVAHAQINVVEPGLVR